MYQRALTIGDSTGLVVQAGLDYAFDQEEAYAYVKAHPESYPPDKFPNGIAMAEPECLPQVAELLQATAELQEQTFGMSFSGPGLLKQLQLQKQKKIRSLQRQRKQTLQLQQRQCRL